MEDSLIVIQAWKEININKLKIDLEANQVLQIKVYIEIASQMYILQFYKLLFLYIYELYIYIYVIYIGFKIICTNL